MNLARHGNRNRSAEWHSAVSPNGIRQTVELASVRKSIQSQRISNPRHSKVPLCATKPASRRTHAFTLIEALVYMSLFFVVSGLGYAAMYRSMDASKGLQRNAEDITQALDAGERWRDDIRAATQAPRLEQNGNEAFLHIPRANTEVIYRFSSNNVSRRVGAGEWSPALQHVNASAFISDQRTKVTAWKWEIEMQSYRKSFTQLKPLFTFVAVPANAK